MDRCYTGVIRIFNVNFETQIMSIDLNIPYRTDLGSTASQVAKLQEVFTTLRRLGFSGAAVNYATSTPLRPKDMNRIPVLGAPSLNAWAKQDMEDVMSMNWIQLAAKKKGKKPVKVPPTSSRWTQFSRITVTVETPQQSSEIHAGNSILSSYDIVAVECDNQETFQALLENGSFDIFSLDLTSGRLPFMLTQEQVDKALGKGIVFELEMGSQFRDPTARRFFVSNMISLLRLTKGTGFILTSGARDPLECRTPHDLIMVAQALGLKQDYATRALSSAPFCTLLHAEARLNKGINDGTFVLHGVPVVGKGMDDDALQNVKFGLQSDTAKASTILRSSDKAQSASNLRPWLLSMGSTGLQYAVNSKYDPKQANSTSNKVGQSIHSGSFGPDGWLVPLPITAMTSVIKKSMSTETATKSGKKRPRNEQK